MSEKGFGMKSKVIVRNNNNVPNLSSQGTMKVPVPAKFSGGEIDVISLDTFGFGQQFYFSKNYQRLRAVECGPPMALKNKTT